MNDDITSSLVRSRIEGITTHWSVVKNTSHFTLRYAPAIRNYIAAMATNPSDVEDILQDFLFRVVKSGFRRDRVDQGKFRYYLKAAIRNAVRSHYRRRRDEVGDEDALQQLPARESASSIDHWTAQWRECLLDRAWVALERYESESPTRLVHKVLRLASEFSGETSTQLAARASEYSENKLNSAAFRQQLHRARTKFAELLIDEVSQTLEQPTAADVESELIDLGLISYLRGVLRVD